MYPTLYHALLDLCGWDLPALKLINSFGLFVALAFVAAAATLRRELDRKQALGVFQGTPTKLLEGGPVHWSEFAVQALIGFLFGWKFIYLLLHADELFQQGLPQAHLFSWEGSIAWGLAIAVLFVGFKFREHRARGKEAIEKSIVLPASHHVGGIVTVAAVGGIAGAKLFHLLEYPDELIRFFQAPSLANFLGGLTIYGGLIVGGLAVYLYARKHGLRFLPLADSVAPGLMLAYGVGRIGCQVSGDGDWGIPNPHPKPDFLNGFPDWMWSYAFPNNVNGVYGHRPAGYTGKLITPDDPWPIFEGYGTYLDPGVYPTAFYETLMALALFGILWRVRKWAWIPGRLFALYCMMNGLERFFIEKIRVNAEMELFGWSVTQAELISTLTFFGGLALWVVLGKWKDSHRTG